MYVRDVGRGEAILLLHGTPSPPTDWEPLIAALADTFRVLTPDLPGYGQSPALADPSIERVGDALFVALQDRGVTELRAIVGFSSGAYRALDLVMRHSLSVGLVVSLAGVAAFDDESRALRRRFAEALHRDASFIASHEVRSAMRELMLSPAWCDRHPEDVQRVESWLAWTTAPALADELLALAVSRDLRHELQALTCPLYARVGELDRGCPPPWSIELARLVGRGRLDIVPGCGHALLIEDRDATVTAVRDAIMDDDAR